MVMIVCHLDRLIKSANLTQKEFAKKVGINPNTISNYVNDKFQTINKEHLDIFCEEFKTTPDKIFEYMDKETYKKYLRNHMIHSYMDVNTIFAGSGGLSKNYEYEQLAMDKWIKRNENLNPDMINNNSKVKENTSMYIESKAPKIDWSKTLEVSHIIPTEYAEVIDAINDMEDKINTINNIFLETNKHIKYIIESKIYNNNDKHNEEETGS